MNLLIRPLPITYTLIICATSLKGMDFNFNTTLHREFLAASVHTLAVLQNPHLADRKIERILTQNGNNANDIITIENESYSLLLYAVTHGTSDMVQKLIQLKAVVDEESLMQAIQAKDTTLLKILIPATDKDTLYYAICQTTTIDKDAHYLDILTLFIEQVPIDDDLRYRVAYTGSPRSLNLLFQQNDTRPTLTYFSDIDNWHNITQENILVLLEKGANPNELVNNNTPLSYAIHAQNVPVVKALLSYGAKAKKKVKGETHIELAKNLLIMHEALLQEATTETEQIKHKKAIENYKEIIQCLKKSSKGCLLS